MKTKGPPLLIFFIALIGAGVLVYVNFNQSDGLSFSDMISKLTTGNVAVETTAPEQSDSTESSAADSTTTEVTTESEPQEEEIDAVKAFDALTDINVDRNLFTVKMDFPADFVGEMTQAELDDSVDKDPDIISGELHSDGSVTYVMTYHKYQTMLDETKKSIDDGLQEIVDSKEYPKIVGITHNDDFTEYIIKYKGKEVVFSDSFQVLTCYMYSGFYAIFRGVPIDNVHVVFENSKTGKVIMESNSRDMGKETER